MSDGHLLRWTSFSGMRVSPSGRSAAGVYKPVGDLVRIEREQRVGFAVQVEHDHPAVDLRMARQRQHGGGAQARRRIRCETCSTGVHPDGIQQLRGVALVAQLQRVIP